MADPVVVYKDDNVPSMDTRTFPMTKWVNSARNITYRATIVRLTLCRNTWDGIITADIKFTISFYDVAQGEWRVLAKA